MKSIRQVVHQAMSCGYLSVEAEDAIRDLYTTSCNLDGVEALCLLQQAILSGKVKRLSEVYKQVCGARS